MRVRSLLVPHLSSLLLLLLLVPGPLPAVPLPASGSWSADRSDGGIEITVVVVVCPDGSFCPNGAADTDRMEMTRVPFEVETMFAVPVPGPVSQSSRRFTCSRTRLETHLHRA